MPYHAMAMELMKEFELREFFHVQRKKNDKADALAKSAAFYDMKAFLLR